MKRLNDLIQQWHGFLDQFVNPNTGCLEVPEAETNDILFEMKVASSEIIHFYGLKNLQHVKEMIKNTDGGYY